MHANDTFPSYPILLLRLINWTARSVSEVIALLFKVNERAREKEALEFRASCTDKY